MYREFEDAGRKSVHRRRSPVAVGLVPVMETIGTMGGQ